jgi:hypothetical protein
VEENTEQLEDHEEHLRNIEEQKFQKLVEMAERDLGPIHLRDKLRLAFLVPEMAGKSSAWSAQQVKMAAEKAAGICTQEGEQIPSLVRSALQADRPTSVPERSAGEQIGKNNIAVSAGSSSDTEEKRLVKRITPRGKVPALGE